MADPWADTLPQWVRLSELPDLVPSKLGVAWDDAKQRLRGALEAFLVYTDVPGWPHGSGGDSSLIDTSAWDGRTAVSSKGWKSPLLDWSAGTLKGYPALVFWPHVVDEMTTPRGANRGKVLRDLQTAAPAPTALPGSHRCEDPRRLIAGEQPDGADHGAAPELRTAVDDKIHKTISAIYDYAQTRNMKPPNVKQIAAPVRKLLDRDGLFATGTRIQSLAEDERHRRRRRTPGQRVNNSLLAFSDTEI